MLINNVSSLLPLERVKTCARIIDLSYNIEKKMNYINKLKIIRPKCDDISCATLGVNETDLFISFRGTMTLNDWVINFDKKLVPLDIINYKDSMIHNGYINTYLSYKNELQKIILENKDKNICVSGHSAGGALATLVCLDHQKIISNLSLVTFGMPKIGNLDLCNYIRKTNIVRKHYVVEGDIIPFFPLNFEYSKCKPIIVLQSSDKEERDTYTLNPKKLQEIHSMIQYRSWLPNSR